MPGVASLKAGQYYAHPRNAFWRIMGELVGAGADKSYDERLRILKANGIALWDVLEACVRPGSLDARIEAETHNDFVSFFAAHPRISRVGLNGGTAARLFKKYPARDRLLDLTAVPLPSTSPAHAGLGVEEKCEKWREFLLA